ncbi:MAG: hypothetical protein WCG87_02335 [Bacteroidota bacterium]
MKKTFVVIFLLSVIYNSAYAQISPLFGTPRSPTHHGWIIGANADWDIPAADMAKRFGTSYRIGPSVLYKTNSNWMFGAKVDFIAGNIITQDSLLFNIGDTHGALLNSTGTEKGIGIYERGYMIGLSLGRIWNISRKNGDNGILFMTTAGFIQHKIQLYAKDDDLPQIRGDYAKGYDRLTNGAFIEQFIGYNCFSRDAFVNFHIGFDIMIAATQGRRDFLFDVMRPDNAKRTDILFGIRGGWYIPIFKRKSEETFF